MRHARKIESVSDTAEIPEWNRWWLPAITKWRKLAPSRQGQLLITLKTDEELNY